MEVKKTEAKSIWMQCSICKEIIPHNNYLFGLFDERQSEYIDIKQRCVVCHAIDEEELKGKYKNEKNT